MMYFISSVKFNHHNVLHVMTPLCVDLWRKWLKAAGASALDNVTVSCLLPHMLLGNPFAHLDHFGFGGMAHVLADFNVQ